MATKTVVLLGTLDTKGEELSYLKALVERRGLRALVVDVGVIGEPQLAADVSRERVAAAAGENVHALAEARDRGRAAEAMASGAAAVVRELHAAGELDGLLAVGGGTGSAIAGAALQALPLGVPKLLVSARGDGNFKAYIGNRDVAVVFSVTDILGLNPVLRRVLSNAAGAIAGMVEQPPVQDAGRPAIGLTAMGATTPAAMRCRERLAELGYEVVAFAADGTGGRTLEDLLDQGMLEGVLDLTTSELADELCGGTASAGPGRLTAAARRGIPQVVVPGALDFVNFNPPEAVPAAYAERRFYDHNATTRLMRTTAPENATLGARIAERVGATSGLAAVLVPQRGFSDYDKEGRVFYDPDADRALADALRSSLDDRVPLWELDLHVNDPGFADAAVDTLLDLLQTRTREP